MKTNVAIKYPKPLTAEGAPASKINFELQLRRSVAACMLWENSFYEDGISIADRIKELIPKCRPEYVAACAYEARTLMNLRHVPLLLVRELARDKKNAQMVGKLLPDVIQRVDEIMEFLSIYWMDGKQPLAKQVKIGLGKAFLKFDEYQFGKYKGRGAIKLSDAIRIVHPTAITPEQNELFRKIRHQELTTPDTWEVALSGGADKKETFERLMTDKKLGALALLRNMRNMHEAGISEVVVGNYLNAADISRVLPFRFIAAARAVPVWEHILEPAMLAAAKTKKKLPGMTVVMVDVSSSMHAKVSDKSDITRLDAACGVAMLLRELCDSVAITTFSNQLCAVPARRGFALRDVIIDSQAHSGTYLGAAVGTINSAVENYDRVIVITDEQSRDPVPDPKTKGYLINVACEKNGVGYKKWLHIDGWSEAVIDYVIEHENSEA